jgi:hypothetical protein
MGCPVTHTAELAEKICERLSGGESLRSICRDEAMPDERTVRRWALDDREGFSPQYARAREAQAHALADELLEIADDGSNDWMVREGKTELNSEHVQRSRLRSDTRKWLLSKMLPKVYGDKMQHTGADDEPLFPPLAQMNEQQLRAELVRLEMLDAKRKPSSEQER